MARKNKGYTKRETPWLKKRPENGVYHAYWREEGKTNARKLSLGTTNLAEAEDRFAAFLIQKSRDLGSRETDIISQQSNLTVELAMQDYLRDGGKEGEFADHTRQLDCAKNLLPFFGPMRVVDIDIQASRDYKKLRYDGEIGKGKGKPGTVIRELNALIAAISHAVKWNNFPRNLQPSIEKPTPPPAKDQWLTVTQMQEWIHAAEGRAKLFLALAYYTASRKKAIFNLKWEQVDFDSKLIHLRPIGETATNKRKPIVPIDNELFPFLTHKWEWAEKRVPKNYVLGDTADPVRQMQHAYVKADKVLKKKKHPKIIHASAHVIRHTRAVHLAQDGVDLYAIAGLLGDSIATVERNYLHHCPEHIRDKINKSKGLGAMF